MALRDSCSQVTLCHPDIVPQKYILKEEDMAVKGIGEDAVILPVAEIPIRYQGWEGPWRIGISSQVPAAVLIGNDLSEHVKRVLVITRSQQEKAEAAEEGSDSQRKGMPDSMNSAEIFQLNIPQSNTFSQEQKADSTLKQCFENTSEVRLPLKDLKSSTLNRACYTERLQAVSYTHLTLPTKA